MLRMTRQERSKKVWAKWEKFGFRAGAEWAECGGVLPANAAVCATFLAWKKRLRETAAPRQPQGGEAARFVEVKLVAAASTAGDSRWRFDSRMAGVCWWGWIRRAAFASVAAVVESGHDRAAQLHALTGAGSRDLAGGGSDPTCAVL